jgi:hypothetical protein
VSVLHNVLLPDIERYVFVDVLRKLDIQTRAEVERLGGNAALTRFIDSMKLD